MEFHSDLDAIYYANKVSLQDNWRYDFDRNEWIIPAEDLDIMLSLINEYKDILEVKVSL